MDVIPLVAVLSYAGLTIYLANQIEAARMMSADPLQFEGRSRLLRVMLYGVVLLMLLFGLAVFQASRLNDLPPDMLNGLSPDQVPQVDAQAATLTLVLSAVLAFFGYRLLSGVSFRERVQRGLDRLGGHFDPDSVVHTTALLLTLLLISSTVGIFALEGGISGVAQTLQQNSLGYSETLLTGVLEVLFTVLGVGFAIRRGWAATAARLGLRWPTVQDLVWGVGIGVAGVFIVPLMLSLWAAVTSPEAFAEQIAAVEALDAAVVSLPLAFVVAISAAVGEEIWIRGGLQPIFGIVLSSVLFALLHTQALLSPGMLLFFTLALALGWLRQRHSTTAAMIAHFSFNFVPFLIALR